jgi:DNA recombination protein RmuC
MEPVLWLLSLITVALAVLLAVTLRGARTGRERMDTAETVRSHLALQAQDMNRQMDQLRAAMQLIQGQMSQSLDSTRKDVGDRLDGAARVIKDVHVQLGKLDESTRHLFELGRDISKLQEALTAPKFRGQFGELFLGDLLAQILPAEHFSLQHTFQGGETVDAVIRLQSGLVPIDAKFPFDNLRRILEAESEEDRKAARKTFVRDVKKHIDAIGSKYIRTDEHTFDFALMYVPAETIYYEIVIREDESGSGTALLNYALDKRVIPVSPNSFYAYLQTILLGLKGLRVEQSARQMIDLLARIEKEFERFHGAFRLVGTHLDRAVKQYNDADKRMEKLSGKMEQVSGAVGALPPGEDAPPVEDLSPPPGSTP